jgi:hypothetical protein
MTIISCSESSHNELKFRAKKNKDETNTSQQKLTHLRKDNIPKEKKHISKETASSIEHTELEMVFEPEPSLLPNYQENTDTYTKEQDTGIPLDPDNEDDVYHIPLSLDDIDVNEEQDTGDFIDADL